MQGNLFQGLKPFGGGSQLTRIVPQALFVTLAVLCFPCVYDLGLDGFLLTP